MIDLVTRGRSPHQTLVAPVVGGGRAGGDGRAARHRLVDLADRPVDELSGGQRQRAWIAMAIAQETPMLLLDEPTTFLDLAHQIDVLDLVVDLNRREGRTIVMVLHDLNQACRYADHVIAMKAGEIVAQGPPAEVITPANGRGRLRPDLPGDDRPGQRHPAGRPGRPPPPTPRVNAPDPRVQRS